EALRGLGLRPLKWSLCESRFRATGSDESKQVEPPVHGWIIGVIRGFACRRLAAPILDLEAARTCQPTEDASVSAIPTTSDQEPKPFSQRGRRTPFDRIEESATCTLHQEQPW